MDPTLLEFWEPKFTFRGRKLSDSEESELVRRNGATSSQYHIVERRVVPDNPSVICVRERYERDQYTHASHYLIFVCIYDNIVIPFQNKCSPCPERNTMILSTVIIVDLRCVHPPSTCWSPSPSISLYVELNTLRSKTCLVRQFISHVLSYRTKLSCIHAVIMIYVLTNAHRKVEISPP